MDPIRIAMAGVGNCASSLLQGIEYYRQTPEAEALGLMHYDLAGHRPFDIQPVAPFTKLSSPRLIAPRRSSRSSRITASPFRWAKPSTGSLRT